MLRYVWLLFIGSALCAEMSVEEKVGQLILTYVHGQSVDSEMATFLHETKIGNIIYFEWANGLKNKGQVKELSRQLREQIEKETGLSPIIAVDQEGGRVQHLSGEEFTRWPSQKAIEESVSLHGIEMTGEGIGSELTEVGVTLNLAPVVDVNSNPNNPVIGDRSFSSDPHRVCLCAEAMLTGLHRAGVKTALKHFPGHGNTGVDSHLDLPLISGTLQELEAVELLPFRKLAPMSDAVMTAHILVPALDSEKAATVSPKVLGLLRDDIGFTGLIITDSLSMGAMVGDQHDIRLAALEMGEKGVQALLAGADLLLLGRFEKVVTTPEQDRESQRVAISYIVDAVRSGRLSKVLIDEHLARVLRFKNQ